MHGEARWYLPSRTGDQLLAILTQLDRLGLGTERVLGEGMLVWGTREEDAGSYSYVQREALDSLWRGEGANRRLLMSLWLAEDNDTAFGVAQDGHGCEITFGFDGLDENEAEWVMAIVGWVALSDEASLALVVDRNLPDTADEWANAIAGRGAAPSGQLFWRRDDRGHIVVLQQPHRTR